MLLTFLDEVTVLKPGERPDPLGIPVSSSAVVTGTVISGKTFVSEDRTYVYTDYQIKINEILKSSPDKPVSVGDEITASVAGGSIKFQSGHIKHFIIVGRGFPEIGSEYLFFLREADARTTAFEIATAYGLKGGVVQPLADKQGMKQIEGMKVTDFLSTVSKAITAATQTGGSQQ